MLRNVALLLLLALAAHAERSVLWRDPGRVERLDLYGGPGGRAGAPAPPFRFIAADPSGTTPKVIVRDAKGRRWTVKWGEEVHAEVFASRIAWAAGYTVEPSYYVRAGIIRDVRKAGRADKFLDDRGRFRYARFERRSSPDAFVRGVGWTWDNNPFLDSRELNGLKLIVMLTSNWDNKDERDAGGNTAILKNGREWTYFVTDWGASMGKWGGFFTRSKWDCEGYTEQSPQFVRAIDDGELKFGFSGKHDGSFKDGIGSADARWLLRYLGRLSDAQIRAGLRAAGASAHEQVCFTRALRARIRQLESAGNLKYQAQRR